VKPTHTDKLLLCLLICLAAILSGSWALGKPAFPCDNACRIRRHHCQYANGAKIACMLFQFHTCLYCRSLDGLCYPTDSPYDQHPTATCTKTEQRQFVALVDSDPVCNLAPTTTVTEAYEVVPQGVTYDPVSTNQNDDRYWKWDCP